MLNVTGTVFDSEPSTSSIIWIVCDSFLKPKKRQSVTLKALDIQVTITEIQGKHRIAMGVAGPYMPIFQPDVPPDVAAVRQSAWLRFHCRRLLPTTNPRVGRRCARGCYSERVSSSRKKRSVNRGVRRKSDQLPSPNQSREDVQPAHDRQQDAREAELTFPSTVKWAGYVGLIEGAVGLIAAIVMVIQTARGQGDGDAKVEGVLASWGSGYGTALWFVIIFGAVAAAGWALTRGKRWGRAPVAMLNMLLLPVAWYMFSSSRPDLGIPTLLVSLVGLGLIFDPAAVSWAASRYGQ